MLVPLQVRCNRHSKVLSGFNRSQDGVVQLVLMNDPVALSRDCDDLTLVGVQLHHPLVGTLID